MGITPIWPEATVRDAQGAIAFHGIPAEQLLDDFGSPLYVLDLDEVRARARRFAAAAAHAFSTTTTHVSYAGKAFLSKRLRLAALRARPRRSACARPSIRRGRRARVQHDDDARELRRQGVPLQRDGAHRHRSWALRGHVHDGGDAHRSRRRRAGAAPGAAWQQQVGRGERARDHRRLREDRDR